jgi:hypothetical protein
MIAGQHWSAATRSERIEAGRGLRVFCLGMDPRLLFQRASARHQSDNCEKEIRRLGSVGGNEDGLGVALGGDETGVAPLPSLDLPVEKISPRRLIRECGQMAVQPREKAQSAVRLSRGTAGCGECSVADDVVAKNRRLLLEPSLLFRWHASAFGFLDGRKDSYNK